MIPAITQAATYLQDKLGHKLYPLPVETFKNSRESGSGIRFIVGDTTHAFRLNFSGSEITGIDIWNGTTSDPNAHISLEQHTALTNILPLLAKEIAHPHVGDQEMVVAEFVISSDNHSLEEASKKWTPEILSRLAIQYISKNPERISKAAFGGVVGGFNNAGVIDIIVNMYPDEFEKTGKSVKFVGDIANLNYDEILDEVQSKTVTMTVEAGGSNETYGSSPAEDAIADEVKRTPYSEQLEHLEALVEAVVKGASNALFVAGRGGTGKTFVTERTLKKLGLTDGHGFFKQTGSASTVGIYASLYNNRNGIILFDDADGALADQDSRNIIKSASDSRPDRKVAWNKRSSMLYDPDTEEIDDEEDGITKFPRYFYFTGKIIFISNLSMAKLDPDGALATRAFLINIDPTDKEMLDHMEKLLPNLKPDAGHLSDEEKMEVMTVVRGGSRKDGLSIRKLIRALNLAATGVPNWKQLVSLYA